MKWRIYLYPLLRIQKNKQVLLAKKCFHCIEKTIVNYIHFVTDSRYYMKSVENKTTGTAVKQLPAKELAKTLIPLPPVAEQKRIVAKLEEILPLCERLK